MMAVKIEKNEDSILSLLAYLNMNPVTDNLFSCKNLDPYPSIYSAQYGQIPHSTSLLLNGAIEQDKIT